MTRFASILAVSFAALLPAAPLHAQQGDQSPFLRQFEGRFVGQGTLARGGGGARTLDCDLTGRSAAASLSLAGTCRANIFAAATIAINVRWDAQRGRFVGGFRDGLGTVSTLSGDQRGNSIRLLATETADSVRPDPPARMTLTRDSDGIDLTVRNTQPGKGSAISLDLKKR